MKAGNIFKSDLAVSDNFGVALSKIHHLGVASAGSCSRRTRKEHNKHEDHRYYYNDEGNKYVKCPVRPKTVFYDRVIAFVSDDLFNFGSGCNIKSLV